MRGHHADLAMQAHENPPGLVDRKWLEITTNIGCSVGCVYCPQDRATARYRATNRDDRLSNSTLLACLATVPRGIEILFAGFSEPWLNRNCTQMVIDTASLGFRVSAYTTGVGLREEEIDALRTVRFEAFYLHLPNRSETRAPATFRTLARLLASEVANIVCIYHADAVNGAGLHDRAAALLDRFGHRPVQWRLNSRAGHVAASLVEGRGRRRGRLMCSQGRLSKNVMLPNGDVVLCCMDWGLEHILGNLVDQSYASLQSGEALDRVVRALGDDSIATPCRRCEWAVTVGEGDIGA